MSCAHTKYQEINWKFFHTIKLKKLCISVWIIIVVYKMHTIWIRNVLWICNFSLPKNKKKIKEIVQLMCILIKYMRFVRATANAHGHSNDAYNAFHGKIINIFDQNKRKKQICQSFVVNRQQRKPTSDEWKRKRFVFITFQVIISSHSLNIKRYIYSIAKGAYLKCRHRLTKINVSVNKRSLKKKRPKNM